MTHGPPAPCRGPVVALLPWGDLIDDFLDSIDLSFDDFRRRMAGGWLFGYVEALQRAGVGAVVVCVSARVRRPVRCTHEPTGAPLVVLPAPWAYRALHRRMAKPFGSTFEDQFGPVRGWRRPALRVLRHVASYLATPPMALARALRREGVEAVLTQEYEYPRFDVAVAVGRCLRVPVFATFQGGDVQVSRLERPVRPLSMRGARGLVVASGRERHRVTTRYGSDLLSDDKVFPVFNPLDVDLWHPLERSLARQSLGLAPEAQVVMYHGRVDVRRKGLDVLVEAWAKVCRDRPGRELVLLLVGTGPDAGELRALIAAAGVQNVQWHDEYFTDRDLVCRYLSASDAYVLPSRHEGSPVAPLEAMATGLPVVAADAPGVTDIFEKGESSGGLVVPAGDAAALAAALGRILDDRELAEELGRRSRRRVEEAFSLDVVGRQLRAVLVDGRPRPPATSSPVL